MKTYTIRITLEQEEDGRWSVWAPDLPGCVSWGHTREEALSYIHEAAELYVESLIDRGLPLPPSASAGDQATITISIAAA